MILNVLYLHYILYTVQYPSGHTYIIFLGNQNFQDKLLPHFLGSSHQLILSAAKYISYDRRHVITHRSTNESWMIYE